MSLLQRIEDHSVYELADQFGGVVGVAVGDVERASEEFAASVQSELDTTADLIHGYFGEYGEAAESKAAEILGDFGAIWYEFQEKLDPLEDEFQYYLEEVKDEAKIISNDILEALGQAKEQVDPLVHDVESLVEEIGGQVHYIYSELFDF